MTIVEILSELLDYYGFDSYLDLLFQKQDNSNEPLVYPDDYDYYCDLMNGHDPDFDEPIDPEYAREQERKMHRQHRQRRATDLFSERGRCQYEKNLQRKPAIGAKRHARLELTKFHGISSIDIETMDLEPPVFDHRLTMSGNYGYFSRKLENIIAASVGRHWSDVRSEITKKYRGRHFYRVAEYLNQAEEDNYFYDVILDEDGVIRKKDWKRKRTLSYTTARNLRMRFPTPVRKVGKVLFFMDKNRSQSTKILVRVGFDSINQELVDHYEHVEVETGYRQGKPLSPELTELFNSQSADVQRYLLELLSPTQARWAA